MDKYEYKIRVDEIKELISQGDYGQAAEIADTIDWRRVRSVKMLCTISDLYKINRRLEDARDLLLLAREYRPTGRNICYALCELSIKLGEYVQAIEYYKEFVLIAPKDSGRYILQYKLYEAQDVSLEERIEVLEELKKHEYLKKWVYELAYLYHRVGLGTRCAEECDELIAMLGDGKYVIKAMELKMLHQPLTPEQQEKYDHRFDSKEEMPIGEMPVEEATYAQENIYGQDQAYAAEADRVYGSEAEALSEAKTIEFKPVRDEAQTEVRPEEPAPDELDIQVKTVDVGEYNTVDLQKEIAQGLQEVLGAEQKDQTLQDAVIRSLVAPMLEPDDEVLTDEPKETEAEPEMTMPTAEEIESSEVFFGETGKIADLPVEPAVVEKQDEPEVKAPDRTGEIVMQQMRQETFVDVIGAMAVEPPKEMANVLAQEADGQISLVVPDSKNVEKQITGQMNIEDILAEWERVKQENVEKRKEEVRRHVLQQTGKMFTEFEAAARDGLLEQLEQEEIDQTEEAVEMTPEAAESAEDWEEQAEYGEAPAEDWEEQAEYEEAPAEDWEEQAEYEEAPAEDWEEQAEYEEAPAEDWEEQAEYEEASAEAWEEQAESEEMPAEAELTESDEVEELEEIEEPQTEGAEEPAETEAAAEAAEEAEPEVLEAAEEPVETSVSETEVSEAVETSVSETEVSEAAEASEKAEDSETAETPTKKEEVVREKGKVRSMTKEEQELYAPFIQSKAAREQIVNAIDGISLAAYTGNVIITGEEGMDTMSLAKNMVKELQAMDSNFSGKIAKISGHALNKKNVNDVIQQLQNGALIVQKACDMDDRTVKALYKVLQQEDLGIVVLIEDNRKVMNGFLSEYEKLRNEFTVRVDVEALSNDTLVAYGKQYAQEMEYSIDELGVLALHTRIEEKQTIDHAVTTPEVKAMVDDAIDHANRKNIKHFFDILLFKRYDENDMIVLTERDFA